ncbi:glycoside hydrolase [Trichodelitschia bisporula]|uniref:Beta-xylanase n=1 Tax=Trichodelitschia bisporula TaxID=703511 RepID=A0A6G1HRB5_9PEZI|nr:glycoside hydrolase [Trichodelitschia bisporula]
MMRSFVDPMVLLICFLCISFSSAQSSCPQPAGLHAAAKASGKLYFGTAFDDPELSDLPFAALLNNTSDFGQITPGNAMKFDATHPTPTQYTLSRASSAVSLAAANGQLLRCHTLVWHSQLPGWITNPPTPWTNDTLTPVLQEHIHTLASAFKGRCAAWDVVNEALNEDGTWRDTVWYRTIGEAYVPLAFEVAAKADPSVKLYYNDYNIESEGAKAEGVRRIVKLVKDRGIPIHGVGLQAHLVSGSAPSTADLARVMVSYTALGVDAAITELDVRIKDADAGATAETRQATEYANVIKACKTVARCVGVTVWGISDRHSWVPGTFKGEGHALPWDKDLKKKPAYKAMIDAWMLGQICPMGGRSGA